MRKLTALVMALALALVALAGTAALAGDTLAEVKQKGVLVAGVKDSLPPFGYVDEKSREIVGYDIDFVKALASRLGVKLELKTVTSASRMPQLQEGNIDIIAATMTKNPERRRLTCLLISSPARSSSPGRGR
jgi:polar amino acid transport system substrate-binding protein